MYLCSRLRYVARADGALHHKATATSALPNATYGYIGDPKIYCCDMKKVITIVSAVLIVVLGIFLFYKFWFVYSTGVNEGDINYFQREGFIFKTYEGKMIQSGYNSKNTSSTIQSNEFKFSVEDERIAQQIDNASGRQIKLHWKRYLGTLPWRGNSQYVVDSIYSVGTRPQTGDPFEQTLPPMPTE